MNDDEDTPRRPLSSPRLKYSEARDVSRVDTGEISLAEIQRETKRTAKARKPTTITAALIALATTGGLGTGITAVAKGFSAHDRIAILEHDLEVAKKANEDLDAALERLRDRVQDTQLDLARCHCR